MAHNCPHCGGKYTTDIGVFSQKAKQVHRYYCESCETYFDIPTGAQSGSSQWLMTLWNFRRNVSTASCKDFVSVYRTPDGSIQIDYSRKDPKTRRVTCRSGQITPRISVDRDGKGDYCLFVSVKRGILDWNADSMRIYRVDLNPALTKKAEQNDAMKICSRYHYAGDERYFVPGFTKNKMLCEDQRDYLQSILGSPEKSGCYVATAVYGSYDCPQVWTLRRFRDRTLAATWHGRIFIRAYYGVSPTLVKWFGQRDWFRNLWRRKLDRMVERLQKQGVESTPYQDQNW